MAVTEVASGAQSMASLGTEKTLTTQAGAGFYQLWLDLNVLANGETVTVRVYRKVRSSSTSRLCDTLTVAHAQADPNWYSIAYPNTNEIVFSIQQDGGTARTIDWAVLGW